MKKFICLIGHPLKLTKTSDCTIDNFENDEEAIRVFRCKHCGEAVYVYTRFVKSKFVGKLNFDKIDMYD